MATRSAIGVRTVTGQVTAIYCHWDGYPEHNGRILMENYRTTDKINELISLGALSSLREEIGEQHDFNARYEGGDVREDWCVAYHRDRGEELDIKVFPDVKSFVEQFDMGVEYYYIWNGQDWLVNGYGRTGSWDFPLFDRVEDVLENSEA